MNGNPKKLIIETALSMGFVRAVVASLTPLEAEARFYENWLSLGYAAGMAYLHRQQRSNPGLLCPEAYSAVLLFANYNTEVPRDPGAQFGRIARYAVGMDYHGVLASKLAELKARLEELLGRPVLGKYFADDVQLFEQGLAARHGLGFAGNNSLLIGPRLSGSYHFVAEFFTDLALEPDLPYPGTCGRCFRCGLACPLSAIVRQATVDSNLCISYLTIENKGEIPANLRKKIGSWLLGCDICQEVCPYNQIAPRTVWQELRPESGAGHFLNLFNILNIKDKKEFLSLYGHTALARPKHAGLTRNALVVIGNRLPAGGAQVLYDFLVPQENSILAEHGIWALSLYEEGEKLLKRLHEGRHYMHKTLVARYLNRSF